MILVTKSKILIDKFKTICEQTTNELVIKQEDKLLTSAEKKDLVFSDNEGTKFIEVEEKTKMIEILSNINDFKETTGNYIQISLIHFRQINKFPCDIYVKLSAMKFVKVGNKDDEFDMSFISKYEKKNIKELFIEIEEFRSIGDLFFTNKLVNNKLVKGKTEFAKESHVVLRDMAKSFGVSDASITMAEEAYVKALHSYKGSPVMNVLEKFKLDKISFLYDHSMLTSYIAVEFVKTMDWSDKKIIQKIVQASLFHDMGFLTAEAAMASELTDLDKINPKYKDEVLKHPERALKLLEGMNDVSSDVLSIVMKHHEGRGPDYSYPKGLFGGNLSQLEVIFNLSHSLAVEMCKLAGNSNKINIAIERTLEKYSGGKFKQLSPKFKEIFSK